MKINRASGTGGSNVLDGGTLVSSGAVVKPTYSLNPDGTLAVGAGTFRLYHTPDFSGVITEHVLPATSLPLANDVTSYLCVDYNGGSPNYIVLTDKSGVTDSNVIFVDTIVKVDDDLSVVDWDEPGLGLPNKILRLDRESERFQRINGLNLGESGTRNIVISAGSVRQGSYQNNLVQTDCISGKAYLRVNTGDTTWTRTLVTSYPNTQYDDRSGSLKTLTDGHYGVAWIWRSMSTTPKLHIFLGQGDYDINSARASKVPGVPETVSSNCMLVGRLIFLKGASTATQIDTAFAENFAASAVSDHEALTGLQGGAPAIHYHSDQSINKADSVIFAGITTSSIVANEATQTIAGLMSPSDKAKVDNVIAEPKNNLAATAIPAATDDNSKGYSAGSQWVYNGVTYVCTDCTVGNAKWASSADMYYFDTWPLLVAALTGTGTTYVGKYCVVANANGGPSSGATYTSSGALTSPIVDGGDATYYVAAQGIPYTVTCQTRSITNPVLTAVLDNTYSALPTVAGFYSALSSYTGAMPSGCSKGDIMRYDGSTWSKFCSYAFASSGIVVGATSQTWCKSNGTWSQVVTNTNSTLTLATLISTIYPVGHILMTENSANPATYLGVGTWTAYGAGRVPVGIDTTQTEFNAVAKTGGEKTHVLSVAELAQHSHSPHLSGRQSTCSTGSSLTVVDPGTTGSWFGSQSISIDNTGSNAAHNNLQPYIVTYMWKRTA